MTARVTTLSGGAGSIGDYYGAIAAEGLGAYYSAGTGAHWYGTGAGVLGLDGVPTADQITELMDGRAPDSGEQLGRRFRPDGARGFDLTFSAPKDVSVVWALGNDEIRSEIEASIDSSIKAVLDRLDASAMVRARGELVAGAGLAIAVVPEHTSRAGDPNLHTHCVISSKVQHPNGSWYALDARELKQDQQLWSALFHRGLEAELTRRLGFGWGARTQAIAAPLDGISQRLCDEFSARTTTIAERVTEKTVRFETDMGRSPSAAERWRIEREAAIDTRPAKDRASFPVEDRQRWRTQANQIGEPVGVRRSEPVDLSADDWRQIGTAALAEVTEHRSAWRRGHLETEIAKLVPSGAKLTPPQLAGMVSRITDIVLNQEQIIRLGAAEAAINQTFTTTEILDQERVIVEWATDATDRLITTPPNKTLIETVSRHAERDLDAGQLAAAVAAAGSNQFEMIVGPAGTGKTTALAAATATLADQKRPVFGLAPSAVAAQVLATETSCNSENLAKFLFEHERLDGPDQQYQLPAGTTLLVDEAGMTRTNDWARLLQLAETNQWRVVAIGDHHQFAAVGRGGMYEHLTNTLPAERVTHLETIHRFTQPWEADNSIAMRTGNPAAIDTLNQHGRIRAATNTTEIGDQIRHAWDWAHARGETIGLFTPTNTTSERVNVTIQKHRQRLGQLGPRLENLDREHHGFHIGDHVVTRSNDRTLLTDRGHWIRNRDTWTITATSPDGITLTGTTGTVTVPVDYFTEHVQLAYAQTSHAAQGRTVDHSILIALTDDHLDQAGIYVPLTRGRHTNNALIQTTPTDRSGQQPPATPETAAIDRLKTGLGRRWIDQPAITQLDEAQRLEHAHTQTSQRRPHPIHRTRRQQLNQRRAQHAHDHKYDNWPALTPNELDTLRRLDHYIEHGPDPTRRTKAINQRRRILGAATERTPYHHRQQTARQNHTPDGPDIGI